MKTMMTIFSLFVLMFSHGQDLNVFRQEVVGGSMKTFVDEHGQEYRSTQRQTITYIYLKGEKLPRIKQLWIDGERYEFSVSEVQSPVVIRKQPSLPPANDTLVTARENGKIFRIIPGRKLGDGQKFPKGVTLVTKWRNYITEDIRILDPAYAQ